MGYRWEEKYIGEIAEVIGGGTPKTNNPELWEGNIPWITPKDLSKHQERYISRGERNISEIGLQNSSARILPKDAVLLSSRAPIGYVAIAKNPITTNQGFKSLVLKEGYIPEFYFYFLKINVDILESHATGSTFKEISGSIVKSIKVPVPPLPEQKAIARILSSLDDKIELNQEMNRTLEAQARAIFKSWFVDFDPVRAKMEGRQPAGMDAATAALFPDAFEESQLGMIPKGWEVKPLDRVANFLNGLALQKYPANDDVYLPVIKIAELRRGVTESTGKASIDIPQEYVVQDGDVLFSWSGSLTVCVWCGGKGALNQHLFKVTSKDYPKWFYYQWVNHYLPDFQAIAASKATTMGHIQRHHLSEALVVTPPENILQTMDKSMMPLLQKTIVNSLESSGVQLKAGKI
jgi:type I restriction enzyme S subunit